jgi:hypothetical protein
MTLALLYTICLPLAIAFISCLAKTGIADVQTLEGVLTPEEAARQLVEQMNTLYSLAEGGNADVQ